LKSFVRCSRHERENDAIGDCPKQGRGREHGDDPGDTARHNALEAPREERYHSRKLPSGKVQHAKNE